MRWQRKYGQKRNFKLDVFKIILPGLVLLIIFFIFLLYRSNIFTIQSIDVQIEKMSCADEKQIRDTVPLLGQNFFMTNSAKVESELKKRFICIKSIEILRHFPNKFKIKVFGREPAAILVITKELEATQSGILERFTQQQATSSSESSSSAIPSNFGENLLVDIQGVIYSSNTEGVNATTIYVWDSQLTLGQIIKEDVIKNALKIIDKLKTFGVSIKEVKIIQKILLIDAVPRIIFKLDNKQEMQIASLQLILNKAKIDNSSLEFIDLRFDKPVVRFAPKKN